MLAKLLHPDKIFLISLKKTTRYLLLFLFLTSFLTTIVEGQSIYWAEWEKIRKADPDGTNQVTLINEPGAYLHGLGLDLDNNKMYWLNNIEGAVKKADLDGSNVETVYTFATVPHYFRHLALDVANEKIYICSTSLDEVVRINFDGTGLETIVPDCKTTHGVLLDLIAGKVYFSCPNSSVNYIGSADLDGSNRDTILTGIKATGMTLDIANNHLYYFDQMNGSATYDIKRVDLDGSNDQLIYDAPTFAQTLRLDLDGQKIWMVLSGDYKIQRLNMDGTGIETITNTGNASDMSLDLLGALPVELSYFTVDIYNSNAVQLEWQTASENNNAGFEIERSVDGNNWRNIGFVNGNGNSTETLQYTFIDDHPRLGDNYYRLKQVDFDGKYEYSEIQNVFFDATTVDHLYVYPNPVTDHFTVGIFNPKGKSAQIRIFDSTGRKVWDQAFKQGEMDDFWEKDFNLPQREMYFIVTQIGQETMSKKVVPISR